MSNPSGLVIAVLAAGQSARFGKADKLTAPFRAKMLGLHAVEELSGFQAMRKIVITSRASHPCADGWSRAGFETIVNSDAADGMGTSVALAATIAKESGVDLLLIALADMPRVPKAHFKAIVDSARRLDEKGIVASSRNRTRMPPACFGKDLFAQLAKLGGDVGARAMLEEAQVVECNPEYLLDIDNPGDITQT